MSIFRIRKLMLLCMTLNMFLITLFNFFEECEAERVAREAEATLFLRHIRNRRMSFVTSRIQKKRQRRYWVKERSQDWWERIVKQEFTDEDWLENFRMSYPTFKFICDRLRPYLQPKENCVRRPMEVEKKVAIALYKLTSCAEYRIIANQFGTHKCVVHKCVYDVCEAIYSEFKDEYLTLPNEAEARVIASGFESVCGIPNVIGAIDGTHIPILPPTFGYRDFINRKNWASYNVMAVVDHLYRFRYATCQHPGSSHDASVLKDSSLLKYSNTLLPKGNVTVEGTQVPYVLLGDPAYPLLPWLIKGFKGNMTAEEESFNVYLSRGRVVIENAFGRLKSRFRCLLKRIDIDYKFVPQVVVSCLILHNIIETKKDSFRPRWLEAVQKAAELFPQPNDEATRMYDDFEATQIRDILKNYLNRNYPLRTSRI